MTRLTFDERRDELVPIAEPSVSHRCPAYGCPNAADVRISGSWACYFHAKAEPMNWAVTTQWIVERGADALNWGPAKAEHEAEKARLRRAALPESWKKKRGNAVLQGVDL